MLRPSVRRFVLAFAIALMGTLAITGCAGDETPGAAAADTGARSVTELGSAGEAGVTSAEATSLAVPTSPADEGVTILTPPTPTADAAPSNAAPALVGAPVVFGISNFGFSGPEVIRGGIQSWEFVHGGGDDHRVGIATSTAADPIAETERFSPGESRSFVVELMAGGYELRCLEEGHAVAGEVHAFTVVG